MEEKVLVTGASGFIAAHCIIKLLDYGYTVKGTVRDFSKINSLKEMFGRYTVNTDKLSFVKANLLEDEGWLEATSDCDYVLHVASPVPIKLPKDENDIIRPAKEGTLRVLRAAVSNQVKRIVLTSSIAAICYGHKSTGQVFTEKDWSDVYGEGVVAYPKSKTLAEKAAWEFMKSQGGSTEMVALNPSVVLGPALEKDYGSSLEIIKKILAGDLPGAPKIAWPVVDVRDVAEMHILAMKASDVDGERFICAGETLSIIDIARILRDHFPKYKKKIPRKTLPNWLVRLSAIFDSSVKSVITELGKPQYVSSEKARNLLGWQPRSAEEAIVDGAKSLIAYKII
ncbi:MAG: aldehyde reductase [Cyclobacteriaceae bacterium]